MRNAPEEAHLREEGPARPALRGARGSRWEALSQCLITGHCILQENPCSCLDNIFKMDLLLVIFMR